MRLVCCGFLCKTFPEQKQKLLIVRQFMRTCQHLLEFGKFLLLFPVPLLQLRNFLLLFHNFLLQLGNFLLQAGILPLTQGGSQWNSRVTTQFNNLLCQSLLFVLIAPVRVLLVLAALQACACQPGLFFLVFGEAVVGNPLSELLQRQDHDVVVPLH